VPGSAPAELLLARMLHERGDDDGARDHLALALLADEAIGGGAELAAELALPLAP
jgi:Tfp pilus assembly protein FimV